MKEIASLSIIERKPTMAYELQKEIPTFSQDNHALFTGFLLWQENSKG
jgi:DNA-binding PadR family transcriptional regulator